MLHLKFTHLSGYGSGLVKWITEQETMFSVMTSVSVPGWKVSMESVHRCNKTKISKIQTAQIDVLDKQMGGILFPYCTFFSYMSVYHGMIFK